MSHNLEDLVAVLNGSTKIEDVVLETTGEERSALRDMSEAILDDDAINEACHDHLGSDYARFPTIVALLERLRDEP